MMLPEAFHPATCAWFKRRFTTATLAQLRGWPHILAGEHTLITAPTGSGKTLAAFLAALDALFQAAAAGTLPETTQVVYVSPLKALSHDIHKNLAEPLAGITAAMAELGIRHPPVRAAVRTGDTPAKDRAQLVKRPPHVLVTTPETLYLLLTSVSGRGMLKDVRTVIVDEIHAVAGNRRGSHLSLTLERLAALTDKPLQRIGLSATQKPIEEIARFLVGCRAIHAGTADCRIVDGGQRGAIDLCIEVPPSPLEAVMSNEVWSEIYNRLTELIAEHRTTLIFVNTRRMAERVTHALSERLGQQHVTSHHGSLSTKLRHDAERRLKEGSLRVLVATSSLELGIDIGAVDLVCQLGSVRTISAFVQRVGRARHHLGGIPKGRLFPLTRDELVECTALIRCVRAGELDRLIVPEHPLDILAQQLVAACACEPWHEDALFDQVRQAYPYRHLTREVFEQVVEMLAEGYSTRRGRRGTYLHHDAINKMLRGRRGARIAALTCGGAIPDMADYRVVLEPTGLVVGSLNEEFAIESQAGDVFQLGNTSWRIIGVSGGDVRVEDARGQPPSMPFWFGEAPSRSTELSHGVSALLHTVEAGLKNPEALVQTLSEDDALPKPAMRQLVTYLAATHQALGVLPTEDCVVAERFFDEAGGMQLVLHAPFGSRINRAWGLALRKRFCRTFNFELQAAASEDAIVLSLGEVHSFPLQDVFRFLDKGTVRDVLTQALLDAPMFQTRWRWNVTRSLAVLRFRGGRKTPPNIVRMLAEDLVATVFPDQLACLENIVGARRIPDHPLVQQTIDDCLVEAMDIDGLTAILKRFEAGSLRTVTVDSPEPSPRAHEIINARPYAFLDDVPLEERRTRAVITRRTLDIHSAGDVGALDPAAITMVQEEAWPRARSLDEVHDALLTMGLLPEGYVPAAWTSHLHALAADRRAALCVLRTHSGSLTPGTRAWVAAERVRLVQAVYPNGAFPLTPPPRDDKPWDEDLAVTELVANQLQVLGPVTVSQVAERLHVPDRAVDAALLRLEAAGVVLRGHFSPGSTTRQWCDRRLLARIHRLTVQRLRREIEPVSLADLMRFLLTWQRVSPAHHAEGVDGLRGVLQALSGFEVPARAWETDVLPTRVREYTASWLDSLCLAGEVTWGRLSTVSGRLARPLRSTPLTLLWREEAFAWLHPPGAPATLSAPATQTLAWLQQRGASFFAELRRGTGLLPGQQEEALAELVAQGCITADGFSGLRALIGRRRGNGRTGRRGSFVAPSVERAGRWSLLPREVSGTGQVTVAAVDDATMAQARTLLRRYGVLFRRLVWRESNAAPWRELARALRLLEARGEIRGGYFISGVGGEQFALPEAVGLLRSVRRSEQTGEVVMICAADPLNMVSVLTPGERIPALAKNRIILRDGLPQAALVGKTWHKLTHDAEEPSTLLHRALHGRAPTG